MSPLEVLARQLNWAGPDTAYNLGKIPEDRMDWKPAPTAKSALEIVNHVAGFTLSMVPVLSGEEWAPPRFQPATSREEAQELIRTSAAQYAEALKNASPETLARTIQLPMGPIPLREAINYPVVDLIHHRGQICYLQTLLGDEEDHFLMHA
jgi:uncharacterized damage-inducible protein DinB